MRRGQASSQGGRLSNELENVREPSVNNHDYFRSNVILPASHSMLNP